MKPKIEQAIKNKKIQIAFIECLVAIGCIVVLFVMMMPKGKLSDTTYSYSKVVTEASKYEIKENYMTRVMPLTDYETFKQIAKTTLKDTLKDNSYTMKVYSDENRTKEITTGYIASGMVIVIIPENEETETEIVTQTKETETEIVTQPKETETKSNVEVEDEEIIYTISVIGDFTKDGDINVTELTKITKCVVGLSNWQFTEKEKLSADLNGDGIVNISDIECCINYIVFGELEVKEKEYTVTFKDYDGSIISTKTNYHYGDKIKIPENPTREADETYTYAFAGWNPEISDSETVTGNAEYIATYTEISNKSLYKVEHYKETLDGGYELAETETLEGKKGEEITAKEKEYIGFSEDIENKDRIANGTILEDGILTLRLYYNRNKYTVTLTKDENIESVSLDGENIATKSYKYGESVTINTALKKEVGYTIKFNKWVSSDTTLVEDQITQEAIIEIPAGNIELTATTTKEANKVTYKVEHYKEKLDGNYELTQTENLEGITGEEITAKEKEYIGFSQDIENKDRVASGTILGDGSLTLKLFYKRNEYTVIFKDYNGTEISKIKYKYEEKLNIPDNPKREADETYTYEFLGWDPEVTQIVTDNAEYTAQYTQNYIKYSITFKDYDGTIINSKTDYHYGDTIEVPQSPTRESDDNYEYEFAGWKKEETEEIGVTVVEKDEVYIATYQEITYKLLIEREDGTFEKYVSFEKAFETITDETIKIQLIEDVTESIIIPENKNVTLNLNNHKITSNQTSTITNNGNLLIVDNSIEKGGMIENTENTVIINNGNLTLGYDDDAVEDNILIKGQTSAVQNNNNFYMYDGTLIGINTITGNEAIIPEGEEYGISIREENGTQIATIQIIEVPEALVGETYYTSLQDAVNENNNVTIIVVKKNVELVGTLTVNADKELTIDLNGNNITSKGTAVENAGTLTIKNTSESNISTIKSNNTGINNTGTLVMKNINMDTSSTSIKNEQDLEIEDVNMKGIENNGSSGWEKISCKIIRSDIKGSINNIQGIFSVEISDTKIEGNPCIELRSNATSSSIIEIKNTEMISSGYYTVICNIGNITIENSSIKSSYCGILGSSGLVKLENTKVSSTGQRGVESSGMNLIVDKGSSINVSANRGQAWGIKSSSIDSYVKLIDGTISVQAEGSNKSYGVTSYLDFLGGSIEATTATICGTIGEIAEGKKIQTIQKEGVYSSTLVDADPLDYVASIGETMYSTLEGAIKDCTNIEGTTTITILKNYEQMQSVEILEGQDIIIDLNGNTITSIGRIVNEGNLTIQNSNNSLESTMVVKAKEAIRNKSNGNLQLNGINIKLEDYIEYGIRNLDTASINIENTKIQSENITPNSMIYNSSTGSFTVNKSELKGNAKYGIYNYSNHIEIIANVIGVNIEINGTGIYNYCHEYESKITLNSTDTTLTTINSGIYNASQYSNYGYIVNNIINTSIKSTDNGIYNGKTRKTIINLGDESVQEDSIMPTIIGKTTGISSNSTATINLYQGMIKGTEAISSNTVVYCKEDKELKRYNDETDGYDTIVLKNKTPEAKIGEVEYLTLQKAIDACEDDAEEYTNIELMRDIIIKDGTIITVGESKKIKLDFKGYYLESNSSYTILNNGDLQIVDDNKKGIISNNRTTAISNFGNLTISNIQIDAKNTGISNGKNMKLNSCKINVNGSYAIKNSGNMDIEESTIDSKYDYSTYALYNYQKGIVNVINSSISAKSTSSSSIGYGIYNGNNAGTINIGKKESEELDSTTIISSKIGITNSGEFNYYGGSVTAQQQALDGGITEIPENKEILVDEDGKNICLVDKNQEEYVAEIGEKRYKTLVEAIENVPENEESSTLITLLSDCTISTNNQKISIAKDKNIKLDLKGYTITSYNENAIENEGKLEITDSSEQEEGKIINTFNRVLYNNGGDFILDKGTMQASENVIKTVKGTVTMNGGLIQIIGKMMDGTTVALEADSADIKLYGGDIKCLKNSSFYFRNNYKFIAALSIYNTNLEINGTNMYVENHSSFYEYGIETTKSYIYLKSGNIKMYSVNGYGIASRISNYSYNGGSMVEISGGCIDAIKAIYLSNSGSNTEITMTGGNIKGVIWVRDNSSSYKAQINILGGTISEGYYGIEAEKNVPVIIGSKDGNVNKTNPIIEGSNYGISGGKIKFYDGTIRGATALTQLPVDVEAGYKVKIASSGDVESATLTLVSTAEAIAQIGNLYFNDLQQAINACTQSDTINILTAIKCNQTLTIEEGKTVTIDLMGNTLTANEIENIIENYGTLTIIDSVGGGSINGNIDNHGQLNQ